MIFYKARLHLSLPESKNDLGIALIAVAKDGRKNIKTVEELLPFLGQSVANPSNHFSSAAGLK
jgi:hypothetical protein